MSATGTEDEQVAGRLPDDLLTLDEAVECLGTSKPTLYRLLGRGDIKGLKMGRQWRFRRADLVAYLERGPVAVASAPATALDADIEYFAGELAAAGASVPEEPEGGGDAGARKAARLAASIVGLAIVSGASDIHLEPTRQESERFVRLRYRIDGVLHEIRRFAATVQEALVQRYKLMAEMNLAERRLPQDGRMAVPYDGKEYEARVSTLPSLFGEAVTIRILDRSSVLLGLDRLGLHSDDLGRLRSWIRQAAGLVIATGPAGSGKTTLLYSCLHEISGESVKTLSVEDPVEYQMPYLTQVNANRKAGLTFAPALRVFLRQDPDVVLCGEAPDLETAGLIHECAITGHLAFTTLHAESAAEGVRRLLDMGVLPHVVAHTLIGIVATRLCRRICPDCREDASPGSLESLLPAARKLATAGGYEMPSHAVLYRGRGCQRCRFTGYHGRIGLFELLGNSRPLSADIQKNAAAADLEQTGISLQSGMRTLAADGLRKAVDGITTLEEVMRVTGHLGDQVARSLDQ